MAPEEGQRIGIKRKDAQSPCKGCGDRHSGCHDSCQGYQEYRAVLDRIKAYKAQRTQWSEETFYRDLWATNQEKRRK